LPGRILVTGVAHGLGADLARRLEQSSTASELIGLDLERPSRRPRGMRFILADLRSPATTQVIRKLRPDIVIHLAIRVSSAAQSPRQAHETNVSGTMNLLAGCQGAERLVVKSSTAIYGGGVDQPSLLREEDADRQRPRGPVGRDLREVEQLLTDHDLANPGLAVTMLRFGNLLGRNRRSPLADYLALPNPPTVLGYDPRLQLLAPEDAAEALERSAAASHTGTFNLAGQGVILLSQLLRLARRTGVPIPPLGGRFIHSQAYRALAGRVPPEPLLDALTEGPVADCRRFLDEFGWWPPRTAREVAAAWQGADAS
jgi:UDP-glucose 4-epimerase